MCCIPTLDLQNHNDLEILYIEDLSVEDLLLPIDGIRISELGLDNVTMTHHGLEQLSRSLSSLSCIKELKLDKVRCSEHTDMCCIPTLDLQNHNDLEILYIEDLSVEDLLLPIDGIRISELGLDNVTMTHNGREQLSRSLSSWSCITELKLDGVRCRRLDNVTMTHHGLEQLSRSLSSLSCIKELKLDKVRCSEHTDMCCIPTLDLQNHNDLEILYIEDLSVEDLLLPIDGIRISELGLDNITMTHHGLEQLSRSLCSWSCIKELKLDKVRCSEHTDMCCIPTLDLRNHNDLEILYIEDLSVEDLLLPIDGIRIRELGLDNVTMTHQGLEQLSRSLSSLSCIKELKLDGVRCREHTDIRCIPVLDLLKHNKLEILYSGPIC